MNDKNTHTLKIEKFLANKDLAIAGASRDTKKFGYKAFEFLRSKGYKLYPIHPEAESLDGTICFKKPSDLPPAVRNLYVVTPKHVTDKLIESAVERGFDMIWMQQKSETPNSIVLAVNKGIDVITDRCIFMYIDPKGGHAFHRFFVKLFGKL